MVWSRYANGWKQITTQSSPLLHPRKQKQRTAKEKKWIDNVREDLELCNEDLTTATVLARDRSRWRRLVETSSSD